MKKTNWAGNFNFTPQVIETVGAEEQIAQAIQRARRENLPLRVYGSGHSFYPLVATPGVSMSLAGLQGVIAIDHEQREGWIWGGTQIRTLGSQLHALGYGMENLGDIDVQSIAGAVSTGTHGTGIQFGSLSTQMVGLEFWNGRGEKVEVTSKKNSHLLDAARVSLGLLGVITKVQLRLQQKFVLEMTQTKEALSSLIPSLAKNLQNERNFEFFWFPHTDTALVKRSRTSTEAPLAATFGQKFNDIVLENGALGLLSGLCRWVPPVTQKVSQFCALAAGETYRRDWSHRVFATDRWVKFLEMEYAVPIEHFPAVVSEVQAEIHRGNYRVHFPIECRFVKKDSIWLSPAYGRDSALIAVHMYRGMPYRDYFAAMERVFRKYDGRPHWGKLHSLKAAELRELYPKWDAFQTLRAEMDPDSIFLTERMKQIFGESRSPVLSQKGA